MTNSIILDQMTFRNGILQAAVLGTDSMAMGKPIITYLDELNAKIKMNANRVFELSEDGTRYTPFADVKEFSIAFSNTSLCAFTTSLRTKQELCALLDNRIPERGFVQSHFRIM